MDYGRYFDEFGGQNASYRDTSHMLLSFTFMDTSFVIIILFYKQLKIE